MSVHYKELSDRAFKYHNLGEYEKAKELYHQLLVINPDDPNILNLLGLLYLSQSDALSAINYISKSFLLKQNSYIAGNLGKAYFLNNDFNNALKLFKSALSMGESCDLYYSLAYTYKKLGKIDDAIDSYKKALAINPNHYNSLFNLSIAYDSKNDTDMAIFYADLCLQVKKTDEIYAMISDYYQKKGLTDNAIECLINATKLNDKNYLYYYNLGCLCLKRRIEYLYSELKNCILFYYYLDKKLLLFILMNILNELFNYENSAINFYKNSIKLNYHHINSYKNLANIFKFQNKADLCIKILNLLIKSNPECHNVYGMLAACYCEVLDFQNALKYYNKAIEVSGEGLSLLKGKAYSLKYLGNFEEAKELYIKINKKYPKDISSKVSLGMIYLQEKNFEEGYMLYRNRSKSSSFTKRAYKKVWNKNISLLNKDLVLYTDCGFGDSIMYSRYINYLKDTAKSVTIQTDGELIKLFKENFNNINVIDKGENIKKYDVAMPFMDIQYALNLDFNMIPFSKGYLKAQNNNILNSERPRIGLFWKGSDKIIQNRSIPFELIKRLIGIKNYEFYSFQIDENVEEINSVKKYIKDFSDTANLLTEMDLLITIDSAIAHLAGALGVKTWLLLPYVSEWRWFNDTQTTSWYDSIRIFKQDEIDNWDNVISEVKKELEKYENK